MLVCVSVCVCFVCVCVRAKKPLVPVKAKINKTGLKTCVFVSVSQDFCPAHQQHNTTMWHHCDPSLHLEHVHVVCVCVCLCACAAGCVDFNAVCGLELRFSHRCCCCFLPRGRPGSPLVPLFCRRAPIAAWNSP